MAAKTTTILTRMIMDEVEAADMTENRGPDGKLVIPLSRMESLVNTLGSATVLPKQSVNMQIDGNSLAERMAAANARLLQRDRLPGASLVEPVPTDSGASGTPVPKPDA